jgi:hypothetical protein
MAITPPHQLVVDNSNSSNTSMAATIFNTNHIKAIMDQWPHRPIHPPHLRQQQPRRRPQ